MTSITSYQCEHRNHLFANPLCEDQTLIRKISNVAFHILTVGIPLLIYRMLTYCFPTSKQVVPAMPYSSVGKEALVFAEKKLNEHSDLSPKIFGFWMDPPSIYQPTNKKIALLTALFWGVYFNEFEAA